jgi:hypothetical protein
MAMRLWTHCGLLVALGLSSGVGCGGSDTTAFSRGQGGKAGDSSASGGSEVDGSSGGTLGTATGGSGTGSTSSGGSATGGTSSGGTGGAHAGDAGGATDAGDSSTAGDSAPAGGTGGVRIDAGNCANPTTYFADSDGDKYGDKVTSVKACARPAGYVENSDDCYDDNASAKPGQTGWFKVDRGDGSYDYDCDKSEDQHWTAAGNCGLGICVLTEGWQGAVPPCGTDGQYITACGGLAICLPTATARTQECH